MRQELARQGQSPLRIDEDEVRTSKKPQAASRNDDPESAVQAALKRPKRRKAIESPCLNPNSEIGMGARPPRALFSAPSRKTPGARNFSTPGETTPRPMRNAGARPATPEAGAIPATSEFGFNPDGAFKPQIWANLRCWQTFPNWLRGKNLPAPFPLRASGISGDERRLAVSTSAVGFQPALSPAKVCFSRRVSNGRRASLIFAPCLGLSVLGDF